METVRTLVVPGPTCDSRFPVVDALSTVLVFIKHTTITQAKIFTRTTPNFCGAILTSVAD